MEAAFSVTLTCKDWPVLALISTDPANHISYFCLARLVKRVINSFALLYKINVTLANFTIASKSRLARALIGTHDINTVPVKGTIVFPRCTLISIYTQKEKWPRRWQQLSPHFKRRSYNYACFEIICDSFWTDFTEIVHLQILAETDFAQFQALFQWILIVFRGVRKLILLKDTRF